MSNLKDNIEGVILFIDDEYKIIESIKRLFILTKIKVLTANSSAEGLQILKKKKIDIMITDYRMPETDGMKLLQTVKEEYPEIIRIILSGFIDKELLLRAVNADWATTFFTKPWDNEIFKHKIITLLNICRKINDKELMIKINSLQFIPTLNIHYKCITEMIKQNKTITNFAEIIYKDPAIAIKILKAVNTLFQGEKEISSIYEALSLLSYQNLKDIIINMNPVEQMAWQETDIEELKKLFYFSRLLTHYIPVFYEFETGKKPAKIFPDYGILSYIGKILLLQLFPSNYYKVMTYLENNPDKSFYESEVELDFEGSSSTFLGKIILELWNIPESLSDALVNIDNPETININNIGILNLVHNVHKFISYLWQNRSSRKIKFSEIPLKNIPKEKFKTIIAKIIDEMSNFK
jgi:CheY-like chemotaxis protein